MNTNNPGRRRTGLAAFLTLLTAIGTVALAPTPAAQADQGVVVSPHPDQAHPRVLNGRVYAIATSGNLVAVGGTFTSVRNGAGGSPDQARQWIFLYNKSTKQIVSTFNPQLAGPAPDTDGKVGERPGVEAIEFAPDGQSMYVGGWFTSANGTTHNRLVQLNLDGSVRVSFKGGVNNTVKDIALVGNRLIVAGRFGQVNGQPVSRLASLDPVTGATQNDFNLPATLSRDEYAPYVQEIDASADGRWLALIGNFQQIGSVPRNQVALIDLRGTPSVANWSTDLYAGDCASVYDDSWLRGVKISPDSSYMILDGTGAYGGAESLCDSAARWELPPTQSGDHLQPTWRNLTGGDTFWAAEVTDSAVYLGGHQRWVNNPNPSPGGDNDGPGSVARAGIVALDPLTGVPLSWNPSRDRGRGAEAITATDDYLFVGSDTNLFDDQIRQRLAPLPVVGGTSNPQPTPLQLPVKLDFTVGSQLRSATFDGTTVGTPTTISGPGADSADWSGLRDGFVQNGALHYFGPNQAFWKQPFTTGPTGPATNLSSTVGYVDTNYNLTPYDQPYGVAETSVATYSNGQIYYVKSGDSKLYHRGYSLESGIIDSREQIASSQSFANARALDFIGDWLYAAWADGRLYRFYAPGGQVDFGSAVLVDSGSTINWSQVGGLFSTQASGSTITLPAPPPVTCAGSTPWKAKYWANISLAGSPNTTRCETDVNYEFGSGAPSGTNLPSDNFSASWERTVNLGAPGAIKVSATADDGVRAYVDGVRVIESWIDSSPATRTGTSGALAAGDHTVRIEYYEHTGGATAKVQTEVVAAPPVDPGTDNVAPDTVVSTPTGGQNFAASTVALAGSATDNQGVDSVRVGIYDPTATTNKWLQADGTWGPSYAYRTATLTSPGATSTTWSYPITLASGSYAVDAVAVDAAGNLDASSAFVPFSVGQAPGDTTAPSAAVMSPAKNASVGSSFNATGTATDNVGINQVRVGVRDVGSGLWLQANGTFGAGYDYRDATLGSSGSASTSWTLALSLPNGSYALDVKARDTSNNLAVSSVYHPFKVQTASSDTTAPSSTVSSPAKNSVQGSVVTAQGSSTDNVGVKEVRVAVYNRVDSTNKWLQANGTWGPTYAFRAATLGAPGATSTSWSVAINLPAGLYGLDVKAVDTSDTKDPSGPYVPFQVGSDSARPSATITSTAGTSTARTPVKVAGTAKDDASVRLVRVEVKRLSGHSSKKWLRSRGGFARKASYLVTTLSRPGARSTAWKLSFTLPAGHYQVRVIPVDGSRNSARKPVKRTFRVR